MAATGRCDTTDGGQGLDDILLALVRDWSLWERPLERALAQITRVVSEALGVGRVGVWLTEPPAEGLRLAMLCDEQGVGPRKEGVLQRADYPAYFQALDAQRVIAAEEACRDPRTREFTDSYLIPLGIGALLDATLRIAGRTRGVLCCEHLGTSRIWSESEQRFAESVADLLAQLLVNEELRLREAGLRELSAMQRAILESAGYAIIATTAEGTIRSFNAAASRMLGYRPEEAVGRNVFELLHEAGQLAQRAAETSVRLGRPVETGPALFSALCENPEAESEVGDEQEWIYVRRDGSRLPVRVSLTPLTGSSGALAGFLCIVADLSRHKALEDLARQQARRLEESENRYRVLFHGAADAMFLVRGDRFLDCNEATLRLFACKREDLLGRTPYAFSPERQPDGRPSREAALARIATALAGEPQFFEWRHRRRDGSEFDAEVMLNAIQIEGVPHLHATVRDVTARKHTEAELARSREAILRQNRSLALVNELSRRVYGQRDTDTILDNAAQTLLTLTGATDAAVFVIEPGGERLLAKRAWGPHRAILDEAIPVPLAGSLSGLALSRRQVMASSDFAADRRLHPEAKRLLLAHGLQAGVIIPLYDQERAFGTLTLAFERAQTPMDVELETLEAVARTVSLALSNAHQMRALEHLAQHDSLTGLPNRLLLHQAFPALVARAGGRAAFILLDLDRFKEVNDTLGHHVGDEVLRHLARRLERTLAGRGCFLCRLGGDEFAVVLPGADAETARQTAENLLAALRAPFDVDAMPIEIGASLGIALFPEHGADSHALLRSADVAMYAAKHTRTGAAFYDPARDLHTPQRLALMVELGPAIRTGQLVLHYQPKIELSQARVIGLEALVRWQHPQRGLLGPDEFLPLAEMGESIHFLTEEVLRQALADQQSWKARGCACAVAVNLSVRNLNDDRCVRVLEGLLREFAVAPGELELEITETALMHDPDRAVDLLRRIAALGVRLSVDDFGIGYSSLSYLRRLPIHSLKIDRTFVRDMVHDEQDAIIVRSTVAMAHSLDLQVVAEGVENEATLNMLRGMECDQAQGFHISPPRPAAEIAAWIATYRRPF